MHRNVAIPDYHSLVTQTSGMDICQIGYDICEFDSLRGLGINIIGRAHFDNRDRFAIWMGSIGKATEPCQQTSGIWLLTVSWTLTWDMIRIRNFYCFVYIQHIWLRKWEVIVGGWLIMLGLMDLGWPRVCRRPTSVLFTMFPSSYHHEIFRSCYHGQKGCPCKRSRSEVKGQGHWSENPT